MALESSKAALNIWCSKKKLTINYDFVSPKVCGGDFTCLLTIDSIGHKASGLATTKKNASANAAFAMLVYLLNAKYLTKSELQESCYEKLNMQAVLYPGGKPIKLTELPAECSVNGEGTAGAGGPAMRPRITVENSQGSSVSRESWWNKQTGGDFSYLTEAKPEKPLEPPDSWDDGLDEEKPSPSVQHQSNRNYRPPSRRAPPPSQRPPPNEPNRRSDPYDPVYWQGRFRAAPNARASPNYRSSDLASAMKKLNLEDSPQSKSNAFEPEITRKSIKYASAAPALPVAADEPVIGGYTLDNAKQLLHQFLQVHKIKADYTFSDSGPPHCKVFSARLRLTFGRPRREIDRTERGASKMDASRLVALRVLQQLYQEKQVDRYEADAPSKRQMMKNNLIYDISVAPSLRENMLQTYGLVRGYSQFVNPTEDPSSPYYVSANDRELANLYWSPPMADFNPWTGCEPEDSIFGGKSIPEINAHLQEGFQTMIRQSKFHQILSKRTKLPIYRIKEQVIELTANNPVLIIKGSTGSGKTTQVPQFILDSFLRQGNGANCSIIVTQPRRISAISISERVAFERTESLSPGSSSVGYSVRFDHSYPRPYGSILFCTTGHLLRRLQSGLKGVSHLIIDEVHERDIYTDLLLVIVRDLLSRGLNIRVIIMSATLSVSRFQKYFNNCNIIEIEGTLFPVERHFLEDTIELIKWRPKSLTYLDDDGDVSGTSLGSYGGDGDESKEDSGQMTMDYEWNYSPKTVELMRKLREGVICFELILGILEYIQKLDESGHVLIFLPGWTAIFELLEYLKAHPTFGNESLYLLLPLHSQLAHKDNNRVFLPSSKRKIILSTNIAETSITIDDVVFVIDTCLLKRKSFCARTNVTSYLIDWVSKSNVQQREGRAGRVRPGFFFALCSRRRYELMEDFQIPEILVTSLVETCLLIKYLGFGDIPAFLDNCVDRPSSKSVYEALAILKDIHAFNEAGYLTPLGAILVKLPIDPRLGRMVMMSILLNVAAPALTIVAASTTQYELFNTVTGTPEGVSRLLLKFDENRYSDHLIQFKVFSLYEKQQTDILLELKDSLNVNALSQISNARRQLADTLIRCGFPPELFISKQLYNQRELDTLLGPLVAAFYPNVCLHKETRRILTNEEKIGLVHKSSVLYAHLQANHLTRSTSLQSPVFVYTEKSANRHLISSKNLSMVSFLQLLLFGVRNYEFPNEGGGGGGGTESGTTKAAPRDTILLDGWLEIRIDAQVFDTTWVLKEEMEKMLLKVCDSPGSLKGLSTIEESVLETVKTLSLMDNVQVTIQVNGSRAC